MFFLLLLALAVPAPAAPPLRPRPGATVIVTSAQPSERERKAAELLRESAEYGRMSAVLGYPAYALEGRFKGCPGEPSKAEVRKFLESARSLTSNYFHGLLIDALLRD